MIRAERGLGMSRSTNIDVSHRFELFPNIDNIVFEHRFQLFPNIDEFGHFTRKPTTSLDRLIDGTSTDRFEFQHRLIGRSICIGRNREMMSSVLLISRYKTLVILRETVLGYSRSSITILEIRDVG